MIYKQKIIGFFCALLCFAAPLVAVSEETEEDIMGLTYHPRPLDVPSFIFFNGQGQPHTLEQFRGKVVVVNLWATWCGPCVVEMPSLDRLQRRYKKVGLEVVPISVDDETTPAMIRGFMREHGLRNLPTYLDPTQRTNLALESATLPSTYVFNKDGKLIASIQGAANWFSKEAQNLIERELKKKSSAVPVQEVYFR